MDFSPILSQLDYLKKQNPFKLREILQDLFPRLSPSELAALSESIHLSNRLKEKNFPYPFWNLSTHVFEQATDFRISEFHAELLKPYKSHILDGCGGAGFDGLSFINSGFKVTTAEIDSTHAFNLQTNCSFYGFNDWTIIETSFLNLDPSDFSAVYLDPMRRKGSGRFVDIEDYEPPFSKILEFLPPKMPVLIKVSPLIQITEKLRDQFQFVFVGIKRECKEVLLARNIKNLSSHNLFIWETHKLINHEKLESENSSAVLSNESEEFIYEPHAALLKSNFQNGLSASLNLRKPSEDCGYFFGNNQDVEHLYERYYLIDKQYNKISLLSEYLRNNASYNFTLKKKNSNIDLDKFNSKIKWENGLQERIIFISEVNGKTVFWIGAKVNSEY